MATEEVQLLQEGMRLYRDSLYSANPEFAPVCRRDCCKDKNNQPLDIPFNEQLIEDAYAHAFLAGVSYQKQRILDALEKIKPLTHTQWSRMQLDAQLAAIDTERDAESRRKPLDRRRRARGDGASQP